MIMNVMMYLFLDRNTLKLLYLKKSFMGQFEVAIFQKTHLVEILQNGTIANTDVVASAIKEALTAAQKSNGNGKDVTLILPQNAFGFFRTEVPTDIAPAAIQSFIRDKARTALNIDVDATINDYIMEESADQKVISFYSLSAETYAKIQEVCSLLEIKLASIVPETLCYFKLFKKTLRKDKKEVILYARYDKEQIKGYFYDSFGLLTSDTWEENLTSKATVEQLLKEQAEKYEKEGKKINRLILSGEESENVRQDTFTKEIGVWTNPLKRIIPNFYDEYLKMLVVTPPAPFPVLTYDACLGAFIMFEANKNFTFLRPAAKKSQRSRPSFSLSGMPVKEFIIFLLSFGLSFAVFIAASRGSISKLSFPKSFSIPFAQTKPSATPTPTPVKPTVTPTVAITKDEIKLKVLNGSGTAGKATEVKNILAKKGYGEILTGNADNFDYTTTEIQVKKTKPGLGEMIKNDIKANTTKVKITILNEDSAADAVVIFGTDFK